MKRLLGGRKKEHGAEEEMVSLVAGRRGSSPEAADGHATVTLAVKGMHCSSCSSAVESALRYAAFCVICICTISLCTV